MLFAKVLSINCPDLEYKNCNFSERNMSSRDRGEKLTKEGAARVCMYKLCNIIHSYTLECGLHFTTIQPTELPAETDEQSPVPITTTTKENLQASQSKQNSKAFTNTQSAGGYFRSTKNISAASATMSANKKPEEDDKPSESEQPAPPEPKYYSVETYENLGKAIMISILDIFEKNPLSLTNKVASGGIKELRKQIAGSLYKTMRFRKEGKLLTKYRQIDQMVHKKFYEDFHKKKVFEKQPGSNILTSRLINATQSRSNEDGAANYKALSKSVAKESQNDPLTDRVHKEVAGVVSRYKGDDYMNQTSEEEHEEGEFGQEEDDEEEEKEFEEIRIREGSSQDRFASKQLKNSTLYNTDDEFPVSKLITESTQKFKISKMNYKSEITAAQHTLSDSQAFAKENSSFLPIALGNKRLPDFRAEKQSSIFTDDAETQEKRLGFPLNIM